MVAQAVLLGGHVRVGLEDNIYLGKGAARAQQRGAGREGREDHRDCSATHVATPAEARKMLRGDVEC